MEPEKKPEQKGESYKLESDIDTPQEELQDLRTSSKRKNALLILAALFIIALGVLLWWMLAQN